MVVFSPKFRRQARVTRYSVDNRTGASRGPEELRARFSPLSFAVQQKMGPAAGPGTGILYCRLRRADFNIKSPTLPKRNAEAGKEKSGTVIRKSTTER